MEPENLRLTNFFLRQVIMLLFPIMLYIQLQNRVSFLSWEGFGILGGMMILVIISKTISRILLHKITERDKDYLVYYSYSILGFLGVIISRNLFLMILAIYAIIASDIFSDDPVLRKVFNSESKKFEVRKYRLFFARLIILISLFVLSFLDNEWDTVKITALLLFILLFFVNIFQDKLLSDLGSWDLIAYGVIALIFVENLIALAFLGQNFISDRGSGVLVVFVVSKAGILVFAAYLDWLTVKICSFCKIKVVSAV